MNFHRLALCYITAAVHSASAPPAISSELNFYSPEPLKKTTLCKTTVRPPLMRTKVNCIYKSTLTSIDMFENIRKTASASSNSGSNRCKRGSRENTVNTEIEILPSVAF